MKLYYESKPGELKHSLKSYGTITEKPNHKYVAKTPLGNGKYRYFYSQEEYKNFLNVREKISTDSGFKPSSKYYDAEVSSNGKVIYKEKKGALEAMNRDASNSIDLMNKQDLQKRAAEKLPNTRKQGRVSSNKPTVEIPTLIWGKTIKKKKK